MKVITEGRCIQDFQAKRIRQVCQYEVTLN